MIFFKNEQFIFLPVLHDVSNKQWGRNEDKKCCLCNSYVWINFYTNWYPDGKIEAQVSIDTSEQVINLLWELTEKEKKFFITKMQEAAKRQTGKSLEELYLTEFEVL